MIIGEPWSKIWEDDLEEFRFPVYLTYYETKIYCLSKSEVNSCRKRKGQIWGVPSMNSWILDPKIRLWLEENIGHEDIIYPVDRYYYPGEERPIIPKGTEYRWTLLGLHPYEDHEKQWHFSQLLSGQGARDHYSNFIFKSAEMAQKFYDAWNVCSAEWSVPFRFDNKMFENLLTCSQEFIDWMDESVGPGTTSIVDFIEGKGVWFYGSDQRHHSSTKDTGKSQMSIVIWFRDPNDLLLTKLAWA